MVRDLKENDKREMTLMNALVLTDSNLSLEEKGLMTLLNILGYKQEQIEFDDVMGYVLESEQEIKKIYNNLKEKGY